MSIRTYIQFCGKTRGKARQLDLSEQSANQTVTVYRPAERP
jgi:hypothetical protein